MATLPNPENYFGRLLDSIVKLIGEKVVTSIGKEQVLNTVEYRATKEESEKLVKSNPQGLDKKWRKIVIIGGLVLLLGGLIGLGFGLGWFESEPETTDWDAIRRIMQYN